MRSCLFSFCPYETERLFILFFCFSLFLRVDDSTCTCTCYSTCGGTDGSTFTWFFLACYRTYYRTGACTDEGAFNCVAHPFFLRLFGRT